MGYVSVGKVSELSDGDMHAIKVDEREMVVVKRGERWHAFDNLCSHLGIPIHTGRITDEGVVCLYHWSIFDLETGDNKEGPAGEPLSIYAVRIEGDDVLVDRGA